MALPYTRRPAKRGVFYESTVSASLAPKKKRNIFLRVLFVFIPARGDGVREGIRKVVFTAALACFIYFGSTVGMDLLSEYKAGLTQSELISIIGAQVDEDDPDIQKITKPEAKPLPDYLALYKENNDFVGWVRIGDTVINYAVCQTGDNGYYLNHDFKGKYSKGGTIFADYKNKFDGYDISDNTVLYGHNIMTGNYFAKVSRYYMDTVKNDLSWYEKYPVVNFDTLYENAEWKVFACVLFNTQEKYGEVYPYNNMHDFNSEEEFNEFILAVMDRSVLFTDVDLEYGDKILTLSTCYYPMGEGVDTRCALFARKVREGESGYVDTKKASYNNKELRFDEQRRRYGSNWNGRVWDAAAYLKGYGG
ncbi:MAG: class B sortase [Oscillospiraceae bacterium]|jgi:sortase B|nr:class B sortase [Oscillospiraceae bacterium]